MTKEKEFDSRILEYRNLIQQMASGNFKIDIPFDNYDEIGMLGNDLKKLSEIMLIKFSLIHDLFDITEKVNQGITLDEVLNHIYDVFRGYIPFDRIGVSFLDTTGETLTACWARSESHNLSIDKGYSSKMSGSSLEKILKNGQPRILNDLQQYLKEHHESESTKLIVEEGIKSSLTCPLILNNKPIGFIFFSSMKKSAYNNGHTDIFSRIAAKLSVIIEKARLYEQLIELNDTKNKVLGMVVHDLRNPITVIKGCIDILQIPNSKNTTKTFGEQNIDLIGLIDKQCKKMLGLINDLLDLSAIESGQINLEKTPADINSIFEESKLTNGLIAKAKNIFIETSCEGYINPVNMDTKRVLQVLDNLIGNAIKFSDANTTITLHAEKKDNKLYISVIDQGWGIQKDDMLKIFNPFIKSNALNNTPHEKGHGLGLAIVKKIIEMHSGRIWVESQIGIGSKFTFYIPAN